MEHPIDFDQLFALRVMLQDDYENENDIIKELRYELIQLGMSNENIPTFLKDFYEHFGINISLNTINESLQSSIQHDMLAENLMNNLVNQLNMIIPNIIVPNNIPDISGASDDDHDILEDNDNDILEDEDMPGLVDAQSVIINGTQHIQIQGFINNLIGNQNNFLSNIFTTMPPHPSMFQNIFQPPPPMQDVAVTLDESDLKNLKKYKLDKLIEDNCSICMSKYNLEEEVSELPCIHKFHSECIEPYLKEYNYKCPICREEVGKPKFDI